MLIVRFLNVVKYMDHRATLGFAAQNPEVAFSLKPTNKESQGKAAALLLISLVPRLFFARVRKTVCARA